MLYTSNVQASLLLPCRKMLAEGVNSLERPSQGSRHLHQITVKLMNVRNGVVLGRLQNRDIILKYTILLV